MRKQLTTLSKRQASKKVRQSSSLKDSKMLSQELTPTELNLQPMLKAQLKKNDNVDKEDEKVMKSELE